MRYLGLDLGTRTLGCSISDISGTIASTLKTIRFPDSEYSVLIPQIKEMVHEYEIGKIILGFPKNMNNSLGYRCEETLAFKEKLEKLSSKEVILEDERLTTKVAESVLIDADLSRKKRKKVIDGMSAVVILQAYLDRKDR